MSTFKAVSVACAMTILQVVPAMAQGAPSAADTLENNLNALRPPSVGAPTYVRVPTPQQSLDANIDRLRGTRPNAPTPVYPPAPVPRIEQPGRITATRRSPYVEVIPAGSPRKQPTRKKTRAPRNRPD